MDQPERLSPESQRQWPADSGQSRLMSEVHEARRPVTDLSGATCARQPAAGQVPGLEAGRSTSGCNYLEMGNVRDLYGQAQRENVHININGRDRRGEPDGSTGSGVAVGRSDSQCFVATSNHVVAGERGGQVTSREVRFADGRSYPANVEMRDRANDLALLSVNTGRDTATVCNPARIADGVDPSGQAIATGFPLDTRTLHASPGQIESMGPLRNYGKPGQNIGDNSNREVMRIGMQVRSGNSGGPVYDGQGRVQGIMFAGHGPRPTISGALALPVTRQSLGPHLRRLGAQGW